jgi:hypothetical protein
LVGLEKGQMPTVKAHFQSSASWADVNKPVELLELLNKYDAIGLSPERYGSSSARTFDISKLDMEYIQKRWYLDGGYFKRKDPWDLHLYVFCVYSEDTPVKSNLWIKLDGRFFEARERCSAFIECCTGIYQWGSVDHAYVALQDEYEEKNSFGEGSGVGGPNLGIALPGIYWANFFGPIYTRWLGEERFRTLEAHRKEQLPNGGWLIIARPNPLIYDEPSTRAHERQIMAHLGRDAFFEMENSDKPIKTPDFSNEL